MLDKNKAILTGGGALLLGLIVLFTWLIALKLKCCKGF